MFNLFLSWYHDTYFWFKHFYESINDDYKNNDDDNTIALFDYEFYQIYFFT